MTASSGRSIPLRRLVEVCAALLMLACLSALPARAVEPDEVLPDARLEERARHISAELRCLVCQNQSIDDSSAPLARDLRLLVRERLKAGDSDDAVRSFLVQRYGDFVLLKPPFSLATLLLWLAPLLALVAGIAVVWRSLRSRAPSGSVAASASTKLSDGEEKRLADLMRETD